MKINFFYFVIYLGFLPLPVFAWTYHLHIYNQTHYPAKFYTQSLLGSAMPKNGKILVNNDQEIDLTMGYLPLAQYGVQGEIDVFGKNINTHAKVEKFFCRFRYHGDQFINALNSLRAIPIKPSSKISENCKNMVIIRNNPNDCHHHQDCIYLKEPNFKFHQLQLQNKMDQFEPLEKEEWIGTHNSAISGQYTKSVASIPIPNLSFSDPNQYLTLTQQFNEGVRFIELDLRWLNNQPIICHFHFNQETIIDHILCGDNVSLVDILQEINEWIAYHPNELIWIYLDIGMPFTIPQVLQTEKILHDNLQNPLDHTHTAILTKKNIREFFGSDELPLDAESMTQYNVVHVFHKNVIVITHSDVNDIFLNSSLIFTQVVSHSNASFHQLPNDHNISECRDFKCEQTGTIYQDKTHDTLWVIRDDATKLSGNMQSIITVDDIKAFYRSHFPVNVIALDNVDPENVDLRLKALIWSWGPGFPIPTHFNNTIAYINPVTLKIENEISDSQISDELCYQSIQQKDVWKVLPTCSYPWHFASPVNRLTMETILPLIMAIQRPVLINYQRIQNINGGWQWIVNGGQSLKNIH